MTVSKIFSISDNFKIIIKELELYEMNFIFMDFMDV